MLISIYQKTKGYNMKQMLRVLFIILSCWSISIPVCFGQENAVKSSETGVPQHEGFQLAEPDTAVPPVVQLNENEVKIGNVIVNKQENSLYVNGKVNMNDGLIEYLACTSYGKLHESVLSLDVNPYHIQVALLLLRSNPGGRPIEFQGADQTPCGSPVKITLSWEKNGKTVEYPCEKAILNKSNNKAMKKTDWVFTGSSVWDNRFMAQIEGSIVAVFHDPVALIDHTSESGTDDTVYFANKDILPGVGTSVRLRIIPITDPKAIERTKCKN